MSSILLVDDERAARENYRTILQYAGHDVTLPSSARGGGYSGLSLVRGLLNT